MEAWRRPRGGDWGSWGSRGRLEIVEHHWEILTVGCQICVQSKHLKTTWVAEGESTTYVYTLRRVSNGKRKLNNVIAYIADLITIGKDQCAFYPRRN